jgi:cytochrome b involved in lipid metabolism
VLPVAQVYNVTEYLDEHPGGGEVMLSVAGKDATNDFEDVGHSNHARKLLTKYVLGDFAGGESSRPARKTVVVASNSNSGAAMAKLLQILLPFAVLLLAVLAFAIKPAAK